MRQFDPGWNPSGVQVVDLDLELRGADREAGRAFYAALLVRATAIPGVEAAALAAKLPLAGCSSFGPVTIPGVRTPAGEPGLHACLNRVSPGYFRTLDLPLLRGRDFTLADNENAPGVAVINNAMAEQMWPGADPVGRDFLLGTRPAGRSLRVVGVVANAKYHRLDERTPSFYYVPAAQWYDPQMVLHVRTSPAMVSAVAGTLPQAIRAIDPYLPFTAPRALTEALELFFLPQRLAASVAAAMGFFALLLAAIGVYGVTALIVSGRTPEMGVRMALGATRTDITRLVLRQSVIAPAIGIAAGLALGAVFAQVARTVLSGVDPADPLILAGVPLVVGAVAATATLIPVRRMLRGDPIAAIRQE
jgi:predicted permease